MTLAGCLTELGGLAAAVAEVQAATTTGEVDGFLRACAALSATAATARAVPLPDRTLAGHWRAACDGAAAMAAAAACLDPVGFAAATDQYTAGLEAAGGRVDQLTEGG